MFDWVFWNDPNFLQWIGWVRDNLEKYAPKIYFIGLSISNAEKRKTKTLYQLIFRLFVIQKKIA
jgi:hypothetical protein